MRSEQNSFINAYNSGKTQLYWEWIDGDLETPVSAYLKLCSDKSHAFLLESVEGGENLGRYSIIGMDPDLIFTHNDGVSTVKNLIDGSQETLEQSPKEALQNLIATNMIVSQPEAGTLPPMAVSGLFGYLGYNTVRWVENIPNNNPDTLNVPDAILTRPQILVIFDNVKNMICLSKPVYNHVDNSGISAQEAYLANKNYVDNIINTLKQAVPEQARVSALPTPLTAKSNTDKNTFLKSVEKAKDYIFAGDIFQAVISQRFETRFDLPSFDLYRSLRRLNPSPFLFHIKLDDMALVGSSPEILVRVRDQKVTIRPIAGTRKRGKNQEEDLALEKELLADEKERAEHLMLLDLGRNDVGAVSEYGSVNVTHSYIIERYSHVMHIVSNVEGILKKGKTALDAFFSGFPAGTVSGAPKIRAMEIIDELEVNQRKTYAGAVGYFSANGDIDSCIALRTGLVKDGTLYVQAGGGVVADSDPEFEYQESVNKAKAVLQAADDAVARSKLR